MRREYVENRTPEAAVRGHSLASDVLQGGIFRSLLSTPGARNRALM
ncbi:MAG: hypothetical protein WD021_08650 [Rhodothermales bacterium]